MTARGVLTTAEPAPPGGAGCVLRALGRPDRTACTAQVLSRSADGRAVVRYLLQDASGRDVGSAVAKAYPDHEEGAATYAAMVALGEAVGRAGAGVLEVPTPLGWFGEHRVLVMASMDGPSYRDVTSRPDWPTLLRRAGAALAEVHDLPVPAGWGSPRRLAQHATELCRPHPLELARARPVDAYRVATLYAEALAREPVGVTPAVLHRDVHLGQLVDRGGRVALLDWDLYAVGDPALDVANLLTYLGTRLGPHAAGARDAVREGYLRRGDPAVLDRLTSYEVLTYLRMAGKRHRRGPAGGPLPVPELLDRAWALVR